MSNIFRQYDIRGIVGPEIDNAMMYKIARAFAVLAKKQGQTDILLGRDNRHSSPELAKIVSQALIESGCNVIDLGVVITPMFYYASRHLNIYAGIMVTASHNPPEYNGCKLLLGESTIYGDDIQEIRRLVEAGGFESSSTIGKMSTRDILPDYAAMIREKIQLGSRPLKVVVDCANGTASLFAPTILSDLGCEVIELYCDSNPDYPNHHPDPVNPDNMDDLIKIVRENQADLGIGFDGDGDRLGVVDDQGNLIWGDKLMILFWRELLPRYPGTDAIVEVKCSQGLIDEIERLGGNVVMYRTGHSLIKARMKEINAIFTGEMSGHMFFADEYYGYDDAVYAAARLLALLSKSEQKLSEMLADIPVYYSTPEIRVTNSDQEKFEIVNKVLKHFQKKYDVITVDGARVLFPDGWGLVRASNTGPELIVRCEGRTPEALKSIKNELFNYLKSIDVKVSDRYLIEAEV
ncbi:MAG: phosphomannomutase/phosphoglucomutase [Syntrophomonadaceae bacterium]|jgi:phosphomannomutase/phosphoglucomutase